jgi:hypothetical protein
VVFRSSVYVLEFPRIHSATEALFRSLIRYSFAVLLRCVDSIDLCVFDFLHPFKFCLSFGEIPCCEVFKRTASARDRPPFHKKVKLASLLNRQFLKEVSSFRYFFL